MVSQKSSLHQWAILDAVVRHGGFAQAAAALHSSQSAVSYAAAQLQRALGVKLLQMEGRRAVLTAHGRSLLEEARLLLNGMELLEQRAQILAEGQESELIFAVTSAYPEDLLFAALGEFRAAQSYVHLRLQRVTRLTAEVAFEKHQAHLCILSHGPGQHLSDYLMDVRMQAVAAAQHPLLQQGEAIGEHQLASHLEVVISDDNSAQELLDQISPGGERWSVNTVSEALAAVRSGCCYGWLPEDKILPFLATGELCHLPLVTGLERRIPMYLLRNSALSLGPAAEQLAQLLLKQSRMLA